MSEPSAKRRKTGTLDSPGEPRITDPRFANIQSDPRYRLPSKKQKVKLDKRFSRAFKNEDYTKRAKVDRYGRPVENDADAQRFREKFDVEDEDEETMSDQLEDDGEVQRELARLEKKHDPLREGKLDVSSSDEESSTDEDSDSEVEEEEVVIQEAQEESVPAGEVSTRIAIVNLDWDNIRADDLMAVFSSFLPSGGSLLNSAVYPSEFGKERMEREELEGPPKEIFASRKLAAGSEEDFDDESMGDEEDEEDIKASIIKPDDGSDFDSQALRQYQLERLRYFYAVLTFSSKQTAKAIYDSVDGAEYLTTANFFDLRFVPAEMDFTEDRPRDVCHRLPADYKPSEFVTDALQHSKVKLTWDQEDRGRKEAQARAFKGGQKEIDENDLKAYLGSDTSDDEAEEQGIDVGLAKIEERPKSKKELERQKARALLGFTGEPTKKSGSKKSNDTPLGDIQVTFSSGLAGAVNDDGKKRSVFENSPEPQETTAEKYIRKEKERKEKRKQKMKAVRSGTTVDPDEVDSDDQAPTAEAQVQGHQEGFDDPFFNEDALNDTSVKNKTRKEERLKKKREREAEEAASAKQRAELELMMADDDNDTAQAAGAAGQGKTVRHFDMGEIEKAEKRKGKKDKFKKKHKIAADEDVLAAQADFQMDTSDPRFGKLFESHEFAIDPTNQKLRQTKGMKELMDEGRRRKHKSTDGRSTAPEEDVTIKKKDKKKQAVGAGSSDVRDLVAKLKRKAV